MPAPCHQPAALPGGLAWKSCSPEVGKEPPQRGCSLPRQPCPLERWWKRAWLHAPPFLPTVFSDSGSWSPPQTTMIKGDQDLKALDVEGEGALHSGRGARGTALCVFPASARWQRVGVRFIVVARQPRESPLGWLFPPTCLPGREAPEAAHTNQR